MQAKLFALQHDTRRPEEIAADEILATINRPATADDVSWANYLSVIRSAIVAGYLRCLQDQRPEARP
jgi:hypothetical protein